MQYNGVENQQDKAVAQSSGVRTFSYILGKKFKSLLQNTVHKNKFQMCYRAKLQQLKRKPLKK
jgi:hypothetical protein